MTDVEFHDYPIEEVLKSANEVIALTGATVFFKFTCDNCGSRQTFDKPNSLYETGECEVCGHMTSLRLRGCNYLIVKTR